MDGSSHTPRDTATVDRSLLRLYLAGAALSAWMLSLFVGWALGGAVHGLLLLALVVFPWSLPASGDAAEDEAPDETRSGSA